MKQPIVKWQGTETEPEPARLVTGARAGWKCPFDNRGGHVQPTVGAKCSFKKCTGVVVEVRDVEKPLTWAR